MKIFSFILAIMLTSTVFAVEVPRLFLNCGGDFGVAMPQIADADAGGKVQISSVIGIPEIGAAAPHKHGAGSVSAHHIPIEFFDGFAVKTFFHFTPPY